MKTILVPTDFTEVSSRAEQIALEMARAHSARLHLMHVVEPIAEHDPEMDDFIERLKTRARFELKSRC
ncbi:MAG: universal stress protein, partial [Candidatus Eremiobacterota bacterium]